MEQSDVTVRECNNGPSQIWKFDHFYKQWSIATLSQNKEELTILYLSGTGLAFEYF
jgi:hypothetical protein